MKIKWNLVGFIGVVIYLIVFGATIGRDFFDNRSDETIRQSDLIALKIAWTQGAETAAILCSEAILNNVKPQPISKYWPQDSAEIVKLLSK